MFFPNPQTKEARENKQTRCLSPTNYLELLAMARENGSEEEEFILFNVKIHDVLRVLHNVRIIKTMFWRSEKVFKWNSFLLIQTTFESNLRNNHRQLERSPGNDDLSSILRKRFEFGQFTFLVWMIDTWMKRVVVRLERHAAKVFRVYQHQLEMWKKSNAALNISTASPKLYTNVDHGYRFAIEAINFALHKYFTFFSSSLTNHWTIPTRSTISVFE